MAEAGKDSKGRALRKGETQEKSGRYIYSYKDAAGKRRKAYSWRLLPSDRTVKRHEDDVPLREREKTIADELAAGGSQKGRGRRSRISAGII